MTPHRTSPRRLRHTGFGVLAAVLATGIVSAQPVPTAPVAPSAPVAAVQGAPAPEEAPPATVATPTAGPTAAPVADRDVAPAVGPKERVAEKPVETIVRRERYNIAVLQALDKVTAETLRFEAEVGRPVRWKGLIFTVSACERSAPNEPIEDAIVYLTIDSQPRPQPGRPSPPPRGAFKGWMFASSPGLNPVQHASYDAWAISCRADAPVKPVAAAAVRPPAAKAAAASPPKLDPVVPAIKPPAELAPVSEPPVTP